MCVLILKPVCVPTSAEAVTFYVTLYLKGDFCINTVIITGFSCSLLELKLPALPTSPPPTTIYPVITPHFKHNVSCGCFDAVCLHIEVRRANNQDIGDSTEIEIER